MWALSVKEAWLQEAEVKHNSRWLKQKKRKKAAHFYPCVCVCVCLDLKCAGIQRSWLQFERQVNWYKNTPAVTIAVLITCKKNYIVSQNELQWNKSEHRAHCDTPQGSLGLAPCLSTTDLARQASVKITPYPLQCCTSRAATFCCYTAYPRWPNATGTPLPTRILVQAFLMAKPHCVKASLHWHCILTMRFGLVQSGLCVAQGLIHGEIFLWLCF